MGAKGLMLNRQFYTAANPIKGEHSENSDLASDFQNLCNKIGSEGKLNLYFLSDEGVANTCPLTTNAISVDPNDNVSPCCMVTPSRKFGA